MRYPHQDTPLPRQIFSAYGKEVNTSHHNKYLVFKGDRTNRCDPQLVYFEINMLQKMVARVRAVDEVMDHFDFDGASPIIEIYNAVGNQERTRLAMLLLK